MAESKSEWEPSQPSHLKLILNLFDSVGYIDANRNELSAFDKLFGGLAFCIFSSNSLVPAPKIDTVDDIEDVLKSMGCPHAPRASQIDDLDYIAIYPAVQWLVGLFMTKHHNSGDVNWRKDVVLNELQLLKETIDEAGADSIVQQLASLLKTSKALEKQGSDFQSECDKKRSKLLSAIAELEERLLFRTDSEDLCDYLDDSTSDLFMKLKFTKTELANKLRESVSLKRQLDDMPITEEVVQYEHRFSELNVHIQDRLQRTRKYYATYNALLEIKDMMLKEMSLLNSFDSQFQDAIRNLAGRTKLIESMEAILEGTRQKLEKMQPGLQVEQKAFDTLREQYTAAIANQRHCAALLKAFQEECSKNERLKLELLKRGSSRDQASS